MKLPLPALLGPLVTKHGALVPKLLYRLLKIVLNNGPHTPRRALLRRAFASLVSLSDSLGLMLGLRPRPQPIDRAGVVVGVPRHSYRPHNT